jgi:hypothetical protein
MNAYARLAIFLGIAMAILVVATQHAVHRGEQIAAVLEVQAAGKGQRSVTAAGGSEGSTGSAAARTETILRAVPFLATATGTADHFAQLAALPAGPEAVALTQQVEAGMTPENADAYVQALLTTEHPAVERATMGALARSADSRVINQLAQSYGRIPEAKRGRILQTLEQAQNPSAFNGLVQTVRSDTSEKRSPILVAAMLGLANVGTHESVSYLLSQIPTENEFFAIQALGRITSEEGMDILRGAAQGNKDSDSLGDHGRRIVADLVAQNAPKS